MLIENTLIESINVVLSDNRIASKRFYRFSKRRLTNTSDDRNNDTIISTDIGARSHFSMRFMLHRCLRSSDNDILSIMFTLLSSLPVVNDTN